MSLRLWVPALDNSVSVNGGPHGLDDHRALTLTGWRGIKSKARRYLRAGICDAMSEAVDAFGGSICWVCGRRAGALPGTLDQQLFGDGFDLADIGRSNLRKGLMLGHCHETGAVRGLLCSACNYAEARAPLWTHRKYRENASICADAGWWFCTTGGAVPSLAQRIRDGSEWERGL